MLEILVAKTVPLVITPVAILAEETSVLTRTVPDVKAVLEIFAELIRVEARIVADVILVLRRFVLVIAFADIFAELTRDVARIVPDVNAVEVIFVITAVPDVTMPMAILAEEISVFTLIVPDVNDVFEILDTNNDATVISPPIALMVPDISKL